MPADGARVAGVVLAAGASTRMGENKLLFRLGGEALVARAARTAAEAGLDPVIVVLGHDAARVERELEGLACRRVHNADHASGQGSSFRVGVAAVPPSSPAAVVLLADMPHVGVDMLEALLDIRRRTGAALVVSEYGGVHAPPTLYARSLFPEIAEGVGKGCGRDVVRRHRAEIETVAWPAERLADLDEPADVERLRASGAEILKCAPTS
jgi:molybdenum cofactor cytidylyltransferase